MENHWLKRVSGGILAGVMVLHCFPMPILAAETDGLCPHHTQHTEECGYSDAVEGHDCSHEHTDACYETVTECVHVHGDCGYVAAVESQGCECQPDENGDIVHTEGCGYVEAVAEVPCGHVCSEESGCITKVLNCQHQHDSECGYVAQKEESPCAFVCEECAKEAADKEAADTVAALIQALPTVDRLQQMTTEQQAEVYEQVQKAYDAYNALTEEQKVSLSDSEDIFAPLFDYFNTQTAPAVETVASGTCGENLTWTLDNTGNLMISGSGLMDNFTGYYDKEYNYYSDAPWSKYRDSVYTIVITSGVTSISSHAFAGCTGLTNVSIPDSVTSISPSAFHTCTNLLGIWVDDANSYYSSDESGVLYSKTRGRLVRVPNAIEQYSIPDTVTDIGSYAFFDCGNMTSIIIPKAVTWISNNAFEKCNSLLGIWVDGDNAHYSSDNAGVLFDKAMKQLIQAPGAISSYSIPDGVASICYGGFMHCTDLTSISIPLSVTRIDGSAFENCTSLTSITIPDSVTRIGEGAFEGCTSLTRAEIGNGISDIEKLTFYQCTSLESVAIADSVTSIGDWAFLDCRSLSSVTIPNSVIRIGKLAFKDCFSLTSIIIPNSVTSIEESAFQGCRSLTNIVIPDSIKSLGESVFCGCSSATSIAIPNSVTDIGRLAFFGCKNLKSITIPDSVTTIGNQSFCSCDSLTTIVIPGSVASIGSLAFGWCNNLSSIVFKGDAPSFADGVFDRITAAAYYPANNPTWTENVTQNYGGTITWKPYCVGEHTIVPDAAVKATCTDNGLTEGAHCSVCGEVLKEQKIIPAEHQYEDGICKRCGQIGGTCGDLRWQFNPVTATLTLSGEGDVPDYNSYDEPEWWQIDTSVLNPGQDIRHVVLEPGVTGIGDRALGNLSMLESVELPEGLVSLGNYCFGSKRNQISHIQLPKTLTDIQRGALSSLNTTEITIPNSVENLWEYALPRAVKAITFLGDLPMPESYIDNGNGWEQRFVPFLTGITATVYYPGGNDTWSPENRQSLSGNITWVSTGENMVVDGSCGEAMTWTLQNGVLEFFGYGEMFDYTPTLKAPWSEFAEMIREVRLSSNCRNIGSYTFADLRNLDSITIPDSVSRIGNMAFSNSTGLNKITFEGSVPYNISDNAFTGVQAFAHYVIGDNTSNMNSRLKDYGGNLIWVEHGEPAKMLTFNAYDMWLTEPGQVRTIEITAHPYDATADCEYSLSQEGIIQIQSQSFRSVTIKALSAGDVTITARDKNTGLTATLPVRVYDPKSRVINCPFQEDIFVDELNTQRIYQFTPEKTGYYALLYPYYSEGCGFSVKHGDEYLDCVSYQRYNNTDCMPTPAQKIF